MKHIKPVLFAVVTFFLGIATYGQARSASTMIDNENRNAVMITIEHPENITQDALQQRMKRSGLKERSRNGVVKYKGVTLSEISAGKVDIYTKTEKGPNNSSVVYMSVSRGYNNFTNDTIDSSITQNVKIFLESLAKDVDAYVADVSISDKTNAVNKEEKIYQELLDEQSDLQAKKLTIDKRLEAIQTELGIRKENISKNKIGVQDAKTKRSNLNSQ